jgi:hypothetical protein
VDLDAALAPGRGSAGPPIPGVVEIVGPPGAGKTSLLSALAERASGVRPVYGWRRLRWAPGFAGDAALLLPLFVGEWRAGRPLAQRDMERMVRVQASRRIAERWSGDTRVMDQGPIYTLATLRLSHSRSAEDDPFEIWWSRMARRWSRLLDAVIYLDANDEVLLQRIQQRPKPHRLKAGSGFDQDGLEWLGSLRGELQRTVEKLRGGCELPMLRFDTGEEDAAGILNRVRELLECEPSRTGAAAAHRAVVSDRR